MTVNNLEVPLANYLVTRELHVPGMPDYYAPSSPNRDDPLHVLKFGGTSVGSSERLGRVVDIIADAHATAQLLVVVSAAEGVTDALVRAADESKNMPSRAEAWTDRIGHRYGTLAQETLTQETILAQYEAILGIYLSELRRALQAMADPQATGARDIALAAGERMMVPLLVAALEEAHCEAQAVDAAALIRTHLPQDPAPVDRPATKKQVRTWYQTHDQDRIPVVPGFIGGTNNGNTTTLGRGGSDYSAALFAWALQASRLERWTDVQGLYTKDPQLHDDAQPLDEITFDQARALTKSGRLGMHPRMLDPLAETRTSVHVRCTLTPEASGTRILPVDSATPSHC